MLKRRFQTGKEEAQTIRMVWACYIFMCSGRMLEINANIDAKSAWWQILGIVNP